MSYKKVLPRNCMPKKARLFFFPALLFFIFNFTFFIPSFTFAQDTTNEFQAKDDAALLKLKTQNQTNQPQQVIKDRTKVLFGQSYSTDPAKANIPARIATVATTLFAISGTIFMAIVIYSGVRWMTAGGNADDVKKSQKRITRASVGLLIMMSAWILTSFILKGVLQR